LKINVPLYWVLPTVLLCVVIAHFDINTILAGVVGLLVSIFTICGILVNIVRQLKGRI
jgi:hypothetical protein